MNNFTQPIISMNNSTCKFLVTMLAGLIITAIAYSQPPTGDDDDVADVAEMVPLDGGLSILLAAGVTYGLKKMHDSKKREQEGGKD
jgi:hypothetical protein